MNIFDLIAFSLKYDENTPEFTDTLKLSLNWLFLKIKSLPIESTESGQYKIYAFFVLLGEVFNEEVSIEIFLKSLNLNKYLSQLPINVTLLDLKTKNKN